MEDLERNEKEVVPNDTVKGDPVNESAQSGSTRSERLASPRRQTFPRFCKEFLLSSWANVLLVFIPVGIAVHFAHVNPVVVFIMNSLAIVPLAGVSSSP